MQTYFLSSQFPIKARGFDRGIFIDPVLPEGFHETSNEDRPFAHMLFWMLPYVVSNTSSYSVYRLDGGAHDRPTAMAITKTWLQRSRTPSICALR